MIRKTLIPQVPGSISIGVFYHGMGAFLLLNALVPGDWKAIKVTGVPNSMIAITNGGHAIYGLRLRPGSCTLWFS